MDEEQLTSFKRLNSDKFEKMEVAETFAEMLDFISRCRTLFVRDNYDGHASEALRLIIKATELTT